MASFSQTVTLVANVAQTVTLGGAWPYARITLSSVAAPVYANSTGAVAVVGAADNVMVTGYEPMVVQMKTTADFATNTSSISIVSAGTPDVNVFGLNNPEEGR